MNSDGEKIPPDDPEPRLTVVASSLAINRISRKRMPLTCPCKVA
jgi:hypothetical protein